MGEDQPDNNAGRAVERVTAHEAATLLGVHYNTVRNRIKAGIYRAEKVYTENGPTWMIERDSLTDNAPTSARQQAVSGVSAVQQEAIQELARAIVRETGISQDPEAQARLEGNKLAAEAARTLVLVASGLLVGMAAIVGILPEESQSSPLLYLAFALVLLSIFSGISWMRGVAKVTMSSEGNALGWSSYDAPLTFLGGLYTFVLYVLWNNPRRGWGEPQTPSEQVLWAAGSILLLVVIVIATLYFRKWRKRRRSRREAE